MSTFEVKINQIKNVIHHPNADKLDIIQVDGYNCIVGRNQYIIGQLIAYIPETSIVPEWLLQKMDLVGKLSGKQKNRVKTIRVRGTLSEGICYPVINLSELPSLSPNSLDGWALQLETDIVKIIPNQNVTELLGITKYEPIIPGCMTGEVFNTFGCTPKCDIENFKKYPDVLIENEEVVMTEKIHGSWVCFGYHPDHNTPIVTSKSLSHDGMAFKFNKANENNLYIKAFNNSINKAGDDYVTHYRRNNPTTKPFYILGEIFGTGVQDLTYGLSVPKFKAFDVYVGQPGHGKFLDWEDFVKFCVQTEIPMVPVLYRGPFNYDTMIKYTNGKESVSGKESCIRKGVVTRLVTERKDPTLGRVILKNISDNYLTRKNGTEFN